MLKIIGWIRLIIESLVRFGSVFRSGSVFGSGSGIFWRAGSVEKLTGTSALNFEKEEKLIMFSSF